MGLERWQLQEQFLFNLIQGATTAGGLLAVQTNQDGTRGVKLVERVAPPEQNVFPCVGVQFSGYQETPEGGRSHLIVASFDVILAIKQEYDPAVTDTANAARLALVQYVNDGAGNGLSPLLRANPTLGATCIRGMIASLQFVPWESDSSTAGMIASAIYTYQATDLVRF